MKIFEDGIFKLGLFLFIIGLMFIIPNRNFVFVMVLGAIISTYRIHKIIRDKVIKMGVVLGFMGMTLWSVANLYFEVNGYYLVKEYWQIHNQLP